MKQHITSEQYHELTDYAKIKLVDWVSKRTKPTDPITMIYEDMSIGQMIEFLDEHNPMFKYDYVESIFLVSDYGREGQSYLDPKDWCDALFGAVKEVLET
jgi:hypothetical protein